MTKTTHGDTNTNARFKWTRTAERYLGKAPDTHIATKLGISVKSVHKRRSMMGIPAYKPVKACPAFWDKYLGTMPDALLAHKLGITHIEVKKKRHALKIPMFNLARDTIRDWRGNYWWVTNKKATPFQFNVYRGVPLGTLSTGRRVLGDFILTPEIAYQLKNNPFGQDNLPISDLGLKRFRQELGIKKIGASFWDAHRVELLSMPTKDFAKCFGVAESSVITRLRELRLYDKFLDRKKQVTLELGQVNDVFGESWLVRASRATKHGFHILLGKCISSPTNAKKSSLIATDALVKYLRETKVKDFDLPVDRSALLPIRRRLELATPLVEIYRRSALKKSKPIREVKDVFGDVWVVWREQETDVGLVLQKGWLKVGRLSNSMTYIVTRKLAQHIRKYGGSGLGISYDAVNRIMKRLAMKNA